MIRYSRFRNLGETDDQKQQSNSPYQQRKSNFLNLSNHSDQNSSFNIFPLSSSNSKRKTITLSRSPKLSKAQVFGNYLQSTQRSNFDLHGKLTDQQATKQIKDWKITDIIISQVKTKSKDLDNNVSISENKTELHNTLRNIIRCLEFYDQQKAWERDIDQLFNNILNESQQVKFQLLNSYIYLKQGKYFFFRSQYLKAVTCFKQAKNLVTLESGVHFKVKAYSYLSQTMIYLKEHTIGLLYANKMLQSAWFCNDDKNELKAYELTGLHFYYKLDMVNAKINHDKSVKGKCEPRNSEYRKIGQRKVKIQIQKSFLSKNTAKFRFKETLPGMDNSRLFPLPNELVVSSSDDEIVKVPTDSLDTSDMKVVSMGIIKQYLPKYHDDESLYRKITYNIHQQHNVHIRMANGSPEAVYNQQYTAEQITKRGKFLRNCNYNHLVSTLQMTHQSCIRDEANFNGLDAVQNNLKDEKSALSIKLSHYRERMIKFNINKLKKVMFMTLFRLEQEVKSTQSRSRLAKKQQNLEYFAK